MAYASSRTRSLPAGIPNRKYVCAIKLSTSRLRQHTAARPVARSPCILSSATGSAAQPAPDGSEAQGMPDPVFNISETDARQKASQQPSKSILQRVKRFFVGDKMDMQRLKALGLGAVASYGCVSNLTYGTGLSISWITFVRQTGGLPVSICHAARKWHMRHQICLHLFLQGSLLSWPISGSRFLHCMVASGQLKILSAPYASV